ncbi:MAG: hypothetical protein K0S81_2668 [Rhodospirillales bacterium]|nr:hypothetical protein [Rhodospirillales bacterium]
MKGVSYRVGSVTPQYHSWDGLADIASGALYITNKKLVFNGDHRSSAVNYSRIIGYQLYTDGIEIKKTSGKNDVFEMEGAAAEYTVALVNHFAA